MNLNSENKQVIHEVLIADMQKRLYEDYYTSRRGKVTQVTDEDYDVTQELLINKVLHCDSLNDVNELLLTYEDLFPNEQVFTLEGTMNYIFKLLR